MTTRRYLESLEHWPLDSVQWEQLSDRAVLRFAGFSSITEPYDIVCELQCEAEIMANAGYLGNVLQEGQLRDDPCLGAKA
jgi:hypothetical protein